VSLQITTIVYPCHVRMVPRVQTIDGVTRVHVQLVGLGQTVI